MASSDDILIVMALKKESSGLFEKAGYTPLYTGIGKLNAAIALNNALKAVKPRLVVNLGTAGCHKIKSGAFQLHQLVECTSFVQRDLQQIYRKEDALTFQAQTHLVGARCGTGDIIENSPKIECDVMDMEGYALAAVCKQQNRPFLSVKYISDSSDENLLQDWKAHVELSATALLNFYLNFYLNFR